MRYLLILMIFLPSFVYADNWTWTKEDTARQLIATGLTVIDWGQTNDIVHRSDRIELNPILGNHPTKKEVENYFISVLILQPVIARLLPKKLNVLGWQTKPRTAAQYFFIGVQSVAVTSNFRGGLRMRF